MSKIVIALGGNALGKSPEEQLLLLKDVAKNIVKLVKNGEEIVLTHGNGPQVGQIALGMEYSSINGAGTPKVPFPGMWKYESRLYWLPIATMSSK